MPTLSRILAHGWENTFSPRYFSEVTFPWWWVQREFPFLEGQFPFLCVIRVSSTVFLQTDLFLSHVAVSFQKPDPHYSWCSYCQRYCCTVIPLAQYCCVPLIFNKRLEVHTSDRPYCGVVSFIVWSFSCHSPTPSGNPSSLKNSWLHVEDLNRWLVESRSALDQNTSWVYLRIPLVKIYSNKEFSQLPKFLRNEQVVQFQKVCTKVLEDLETETMHWTEQE